MTDADGSLPMVVVVVPIYDDWQSFAVVAQCLATLWQAHPCKDRARLQMVVVNDAPHLAACRPAHGGWEECGIPVQILALMRNMGHQRAITIGITHALRTLAPDFIVVMDGDGEDNPADVPKLIAAALESDDSQVIFAERTWRGDAWWFRTGYAIYRLLHKITTGHRIRFGNFSIVPARFARVVVTSSEAWCHYAAAIVRLRLPYKLLPTRRSSRIQGRPRMSPVTLVAHGLSAISLFYDVASVRLMAIFFLGLGLCAATKIAGHLVQPAQQSLEHAMLDISQGIGIGVAASAWMLVTVLLLFRSKMATDVIPSSEAAAFIHPSSAPQSTKS